MKLVLSPRYSEDSQKIWHAATTRGWDVERLQGWRAEDIGEVDAIYGETLWARTVATQVGRELIEPPLNWLCGVPQELLRRKVRFGTAEDLGHIQLPMFIKPADDKSFEARVYQTPPSIPRDTLVLVSDECMMLMEFRVWVLNGKPVTGSLYRHSESIDPAVAESHLSQALWTAERCARSPNTPPAVVIDVARTINGAWVAIEANPCFGSGIYNADADKVLDVLAAACVTTAPPEFVQKVTLV